MHRAIGQVAIERVGDPETSPRTSEQPRAISVHKARSAVSGSQAPRRRPSLQTMKLNLLGEWLSWLEETEQCESDFAPYLDSSETSIESEQQQLEEEQQRIHKRQFRPVKRLCERDNIIIDMLNSAASGGTSTVSFCVTDPSQLDNPIVYISDGFSKLTGYDFDEVVGRNCRFLQGPETDRRDVEKIIHAIKTEKECSVNILNYKKDGTKFRNEFYLAQLRSPTQEIAYFIGMQAAVDGDEDRDGIIPSNPGACSNASGEMKVF